MCRSDYWRGRGGGLVLSSVDPIPLVLRLKSTDSPAGTMALGVKKLLGEDAKVSAVESLAFKQKR